MSRQSSRNTPIDDEYGTCIETRAKLLIYPGEMSPHEVTRRLGVEPTEANVAGEERLNRLGRQRVIKLNGWFLSSEGHVTSLDTRRHLDWLLARIEPKKEALLALQSVPGVRMTVSCPWYSRSGHGGPTLWPEQMRALADLNLECGFDFYFLPDDDE
jgi:hypothetical protein